MKTRSQEHRSKEYFNLLGIVVLALLVTLLMAGCGQAGAQSESSESQPANSESAREESETVAESDAAVSAEVGPEDLIAQGEEIFQKTAGGIGCQACHGKNAQGDVGPNIVGKSAEAIQIQLDSNEAMQFIILSQQEIEAVAAYLKWLQTQQQQ